MDEILVIEDDPVLARGLQVILELEKYKIILANSVKSALHFINDTISLVLLDINLPDGSGFDLLKKIRKSYVHLPIIILTAKVDETFVVFGLESGANDYIRKPFGNRELIARINGTLKKSTGIDKKFQFGDFELLQDQRRVKYRGNEVELNRREFDILHFLLKKSETVITRNAILNNIDKECKISDRTIDSHISHLRSSLKKAGVKEIKIISVYGIGYRLEKS